MADITINANKLVNTGGVYYVPSEEVAVAQETMTYNGAKIAELQTQIDEVGGALAWIQTRTTTPA